VNVNNGFVATLNRFHPRANVFRGMMPESRVAERRVGGVEEIFLPEDSSLKEGGSVLSQKERRGSGFRELISNALEIDISEILRPKSFLYLLGATGIFLLQTYNTLAIISLAQQNEKIREQIHMTSSVITTQELKVHELHSIHNIAQDAASLGLVASSVPAVHLEP
jgi:hypothetical protein